MTAILAALSPYIFPALGSLVTAGLGWLTYKLNSRWKADAAQNKIGNIVLSSIGAIWTKLGPTVQTLIATGKLDKASRSQIEGVLLSTVDQPTLEGVASALGVPFSSIVSELVERMIHTWAAAHDPNNPAVSALAYPAPAAAAGAAPALPDASDKG